MKRRKEGTQEETEVMGDGQPFNCATASAHQQEQVARH